VWLGNSITYAAGACRSAVWTTTRSLRSINGPACLVVLLEMRKDGEM
jgi:hypothetical protein